MNILTKFSALALIAVLTTACAPDNDDDIAGSPTAPATTADSVAPTTTAGAEAADGQSASATGTVTSIDRNAGTVTIDHGPVAALEWPAMTMGFKATPKQLAELTTGERVQFEFVARGMEATITSISPEQ